MGDSDENAPAAGTDDLIAHLRAADRAVRLAAAHELVARGQAERAVAVVDDGDPGLVMIVLRALRDRELAPGIPELLWASRHRQANVDALVYWSRTDPERAEAAAGAGLLSRSRVVRRRSQGILRLAGVDLAERYRVLLADGHDEAARALGEFGGPADVPALLARLDAPGPRMRRFALGAIARLLRKDAEPLLASLLSSPDPVLSGTADRMLARLGPSRATLDLAWALYRSQTGAGWPPYSVFSAADTWWQLRHACLEVAAGSGPRAEHWRWRIRNCLTPWHAPSAAPDPAERDAICDAVSAALPHLPDDVAAAVRRVTDPYLRD